eukprot:Rmarinus@m.17663
MEKYRSFADPKSGIHPFLNSPNSPKQLISIDSLFYFPLGLFLFTIRIAVLIVSLSILFVAEFLCVSLSLIPPLRCFICHPLRVLGARGILLALGIWACTSKLHYSSRKTWPRPGHGDVVMCNFTSYVDVFVLMYLFDPVFVLPSHEKCGHVVHLGYWDLIMHAWHGSPFPEGSGLKLEDVSRNAKYYSRGPVVVFPEGTTSNGKAILKIQPVLSRFHNPDVALLVVCMAYGSPFRYSFTGGTSVLLHLLHLLYMRGSQVVLHVQSDHRTNKLRSIANESVGNLHKLLQKQMADLLGAQVVDVDFTSKPKFLNQLYMLRKQGFRSQQ